MTRFLRATALLALVPFAAAAQQPAAPPAGRPVQLRMDTGTFRYSTDAALAEVYLSIGAVGLRYTRGASAFETSVPVRVTVRPVAVAAPAGAASGAVYDQTTEYRFSVADTTALSAGQVFTEQIRTALAPGEYEVEAAAGGTRAVVPLSVPDYGSARGATLSSLQLARRIARSAEPSGPLVKGGRIVQPYPDAFYGGDLGRVTYYAEAYGAATGSDAGSDAAGAYTVLSFLSSASRPTPIEGTETRTEHRAQPVDVLVGAIDVSALPTGEYVLHLALLNAANEAVAERSKRLFVINPDVAQPAQSVAEATDDEILYATMGEEELTLNVDHVRVIATSRERSELGAARTDDDRRAYLVRFWRNRTTAAPAGTNARRTFYDRLARVNDRYRYGGSPGYRTDRGRVFLQYGAPSGVDRQAFNADTAPFEVWTYENVPGEGLSEFVFVDRNNSGEMALVHSTVTGEVSLPRWQAEILNR